MSKFGLRAFAASGKKPAPSAAATPSVAYIDGLIAGYEALEALEAIMADIKTFGEMESGITSLTSIFEAIEKHGVDRSLIAFCGQEMAGFSDTLFNLSDLEEIPDLNPPATNPDGSPVVPAAPAAPATNPDGTPAQTPAAPAAPAAPATPAVPPAPAAPAAPAAPVTPEETQEIKKELTASTEMSIAEMKQFVKTLIAKILEWLKKFFTNSTSLANAIKTAHDSIEATNAKPADEIKAVSVLGYKKDAFEARIKAAKEITSQLKATIELFKSDKTVEEIEAEIGKAMTSFGWTVVDGKATPPAHEPREQKTIGELGFNSKEDITAHAAAAQEVLKGLETLEGVVKEAEAAAEAKTTTTGMTSQAFIGAVGKIVSFVSKEAYQLGMQELKMLKACIGSEKGTDPQDGSGHPAASK
jgi:Holliday junction resolvasome RuvABC DNA-binding subunit